MPDPSDSEFRELRQVFVTEAEQHLCVLEEGLVDLETHPGDGDRLRTIFRSMHTIKGSASLVNLPAIERLAHGAEDILSSLRDGEAPATSGAVSLLLRAVDALRRMVAEVASSGAPDGTPYAQLVTELAAWRPNEESADAGIERVDGAAADLADSTDGGPAGAPWHAVRSGHMRVDVAKLDRLLEVTTEIVLVRRSFAARLAAAEGANLRPLRETFEDDGRLFDELRDAVLELRMVALGPTLRRFARSVRDMARTAGKQVRLVVEGEDVEVDTSIVERLVDPLTHLVRNAVDHGIESPGARVAAGKDATGTIILRARRDPASLVIEVADDGVGLSRARVAACAREHGVADPEAMTDAQLWGLLFEPGFSTAQQLSELSGRGVGLDAVRRAVEALRGSVEIAPRRVGGAVATLRVPFTLSMVDGIEVEVGDGTFIIPLENVVACMAAPGTVREDDGVLEYGDETLPYVRLRRVFASPGAVPAREQMLVVRHAGLSACLVVDRLLGEVETAVRPLGSGLSNLSPLGGSAVLRDGRIGLVLDVPTLLRELVSGAGAIRHAPESSPRTH